MEERHIYPIFDRMLQRSDRENLLKQKGLMLWFTGLSGSGKSTLAIALEREYTKTVYYAESSTAIIFAAASITISVFLKPTELKIFGGSLKYLNCL